MIGVLHAARLCRKCAKTRKHWGNSSLNVQNRKKRIGKMHVVNSFSTGAGRLHVRRISLPKQRNLPKRNISWEILRQTVIMRMHHSHWNVKIFKKKTGSQCPIPLKRGKPSSPDLPHAIASNLGSVCNTAFWWREVRYIHCVSKTSHFLTCCIFDVHQPIILIIFAWMLLRK